MKKRILIDDLRNIEADVVCRNATKAYTALENGIFEEYIFDHDLGSTAPGTSGYDILSWALENSLIHGKVYLVTSNPVGKDNMKRALEAYGFKLRGNWFIKEDR